MRQQSKELFFFFWYGPGGVYEFLNLARHFNQRPRCDTQYIVGVKQWLGGGEIEDAEVGLLKLVAVPR